MQPNVLKNALAPSVVCHLGFQGFYNLENLENLQKTPETMLAGNSSHFSQKHLSKIICETLENLKKLQKPQNVLFMVVYN